MPIELIIIAVVAFILVIALFMLLGKRRTPDLEKQYKKFMETRVMAKTIIKQKKQDMPTPQQPTVLIEGKGELFDKFRKLQTLDPFFSPKIFKIMAEDMFENIMELFSLNSLTSIKNSMNETVYVILDTKIKKLIKNNQTRSHILVSFDSINITKVNIADTNVDIEVQFQTEQINATYKIGRTAPKKNTPKMYRDTWTFSRNYATNPSAWIVSNISI